MKQFALFQERLLGSVKIFEFEHQFGANESPQTCGQIGVGAAYTAQTETPAPV
ncbi:MAG: hypothetical protein SGJ17_05670 [Hyphomicrobiales bacterium]|nr:hypothetical protein [Hyphomicrobiales bacterium]